MKITRRILGLFSVIFLPYQASAEEGNKNIQTALYCPGRDNYGVDYQSVLHVFYGNIELTGRHAEPEAAYEWKKMLGQNSMAAVIHYDSYNGDLRIIRIDTAPIEKCPAKLGQ